VPGAQDEHLGIEIFFAPFREQLQAAAVGQADVEDDDVKRAFRQGILGFLAVPRPDGGIRNLLQSFFTNWPIFRSSSTIKIFMV